MGKIIVQDGETVPVEAVVCAVPLPAFLKICPPEIQSDYVALEKTRFSSILSVNLWFSEPFFDGAFEGMLDTDFQWVFNRHHLWRGVGVSRGAVSLVLSAAEAFADLPAETLIRKALADLRACYPGFTQEPRHASVVWEKTATPEPSPEFWAARPPVRTSLQNFFLAGDWVDSGLPPTIEAASRSGHRAAQEADAFLSSAMRGAELAAAGRV